LPEIVSQKAIKLLYCRSVRLSTATFPSLPHFSQLYNVGLHGLMKPQRLVTNKAAMKLN